MERRMLYSKLIYLVIFLIVAVLSFTVLADRFTSVENHKETLAALEDKKMTALGLTASVTAVSTAISAIPGDVATPIAERISELTTPLLIIVCAIYLEKFLLTTLGFLSFKVFIPVACVIGGIGLFLKEGPLKELAVKFSVKLAIFAVAIVCIIPTSVKVTGLIEATFEESIELTYDTVEQVSKEAEKSTEAEESNAFLAFLASIGDEATELVESVKNALSVFIDAVAVLIITTCVIPVAVLLLFMWLIKQLLGINIKVPRLPGFPKIGL